MSAWSSVEGVIRFSIKEHHCSLETLIKSLYSEMHCNVRRAAVDVYEVSFRFSLENEAAFEVVQEFAKRVKRVEEYDRNATIDISATIRYIA